MENTITDLVFYHTVLKCHILIDLKTHELTHADLGQLLLFFNYRSHNMGVRPRCANTQTVLTTTNLRERLIMANVRIPDCASAQNTFSHFNPHLVKSPRHRARTSGYVR